MMDISDLWFMELLLAVVCIAWSVWLLVLKGQVFPILGCIVLGVIAAYIYGSNLRKENESSIRNRGV